MVILYGCSVRKTRSDKLPDEERLRRRRTASNQYHKDHAEQIGAQRRTRREGLALKEYGLRSNHKMTLEQWEDFWDRQQGACYLCERPMTRPLPGRGTGRKSDAGIDHDHRCCPQGKSCPACWRGLAHRVCNAMVGAVEDDPDLLTLIAENLRRAREEVMPDAK